MASLSNINGIFDVHSTGAVQFNGNHGASGQILKSNGNAAPTWIPQSDIVGAYLPLAGGTLTGATATASGINFTVGGTLTASNFSGSSSGTNTGDQTSVTGASGYLDTNRGTPSSAAQYWQASGLGTTEAPSTDWYTTLRLGHGNPVTYYGNTLAIKMTGSGSGDIYTQNLANGTFQGWKKYWNDSNFNPASYLPLSGGTLTGALTGTSATFSGNVTAATFNTLPIETARNNNADRIVRTNVHGYVDFGWINTTSGATTSTIDRIYASNDGYIRYVTPATFRTQVTDPYYAPAGTVSGVTSVATGNGLTGGTITSTGTLTMSGTYSGSMQFSGAHGSSQVGCQLPAANNGAGTGVVNLRMWCSEPGVTWDWAGFGYNVTNDNGSPSGFGRLNTAFGQAYQRYSTSGDMYFYNTNTAGARVTTLTLNNNGQATFGYTVTAPTFVGALTGNATTASSAAQVTINYNDNSNANYQMLWGSGNNVYGTAGVVVNAFSNTVTATTFSGSLSGNANSATTASNVGGLTPNMIVSGGSGRKSTRVYSFAGTSEPSGFYYGSNIANNPPTTDWVNYIQSAGDLWTSGNNYSFQLTHAFHSDNFWVSRTTNGSQSTARLVLDGGGSSQTKSGALTSGTSMTAPVFYDYNNAAYYGNFASTSNINALTLVGTLSGQNGYFLQDVGIGFNSGNIGGKLNIQINSSSGIGIKNNLNGVSNPTGLLQYTSASMNSGGYYMVFQAAPTSGSDTNMLLCNLNGNLRNRNNSYGQYSDETIKENITDATPKLEDVKKLKVKNFNFIGDDLKQIGLIAQETEKVFPGLVEDDLNPQGDRIKSLKYSVLVPILVKAIQELEVRVKELENK